MRYKARGFTLIELVITVAILAIIAAWGVPAWQQFVARSQVDSDARALVHALALARSEAVSSGEEVSVCPYSADFNSAGASDCGGSWQAGWVVYRGNGSTIAANQSLWVHGETASRALTGGAGRVTFNALGTLDSGNGTWKLCSGEALEDVVLASSGRVRRGQGSGCT